MDVFVKQPFPKNEIIQLEQPFIFIPEDPWKWYRIYSGYIDLVVVFVVIIM